jgi:hypothetical protein
MKKTVITGIIVILVLMLLGTCDAIVPVDEEVEYTDVVYSADEKGVINQVTLYIDGTTVPVTKSMRAMNRELAMMAFDYFEVLFVGGTNNAAGTARTAWELGEQAGISNVPGKTGASATTGINYVYQAGTGTGLDTFVINATTGVACMFVGKKGGGKTLLGVGSLTATRGTPAATNATTIDQNTKSVTFSINSLQAGLHTTGETIGGTPAAPAGVVANSFTIANGTSTLAVVSTRQGLGGISYPLWQLPQDDTKTKLATYTFSFNGSGGASTPASLIRVINTQAAGATLVGTPTIQKRVPRYLEGGAYREPKDRWTTLTKVDFTTQIAAGPPAIMYVANNGAFIPAIPLTITLQGTGILSFYVEIPVYMHSLNEATFNTGTAAEKWHIRSGVGSELYSLDDGISNGGCVYLSVGASAAFWIEIEWVWVP